MLDNVPQTAPAEVSMAGMDYRRLAHKFFEGKLTAQELAERVEELRRRGPQLRLFTNEEVKDRKDVERLRAGR